MKSNKTILLTIVAFASLSIFAGLCSPAAAQEKSTKLKIGVYDSRIVVLAYSRSDFFSEKMKKFQEASTTVMESGDTVRMKEAAFKAITEQYLNHQMVFCSGSAAAILNLIRDKLPGLAKEAGVSMVVSKWELTYADPSAEIIDLTMKVASLFEPKQDIEAMAGEFRKTEPIPLYDLTVEEVIEMWDQYKVRYKK